MRSTSSSEGPDAVAVGPGPATNGSAPAAAAEGAAPRRTVRRAGGGGADAERDGLPLGPGSLTWKVFGDLRGLITVGRTGTLQTMHPTISQALVDHSDYFENPLNRILRSSGPILRVVYGRDPEGTGRQVRDWHKPIKGEHAASGERYRALDADAYYWAHATFFESQINRMELFGTPLSEDEKRRLYRESITWYSRYGVSMKPVPRTYEDFLEYWDHMLEHVLAATPVAMDAVHRTDPMPSPFDHLPRGTWTVLGPVISKGGPWMTRGTLPERAREILGVKWGAADEAALRALRVWVRTTWPLLPDRVKRMDIGSMSRSGSARD